MPYTLLDPSTAAAAPATTAGAPLTSVGETLLSIRTELLADLQNRADVGTSRLNKWINWGYRNIAQMLDLTELWSSVGVSAVASQPFYLVPPALSWIKRLSIEDSTDFPGVGGQDLDMIDEQTYRTLPDTSALSPGNPTIPECYFRWARMVVIWPTPSTSFTLNMDFRVRPLDMSNDTDSPILPTEFHEAIVYAALERAWRALRNTQAAAIAANDKLMIMRPLLNSDAEERNNMNVTLTPVRSYASLRSRSRG